MGTTCGIIKRNGKEIKQVVIPIQRPRYLTEFPPPDLRAAKIGPYFLKQVTSDKLLENLGK